MVSVSIVMLWFIILSVWSQIIDSFSAFRGVFPTGRSVWPASPYFAHPFDLHGLLKAHISTKNVSIKMVIYFLNISCYYSHLARECTRIINCISKKNRCRISLPRVCSVLQRLFWHSDTFVYLCAISTPNADQSCIKRW